jgi:hypothetical protein
VEISLAATPGACGTVFKPDATGKEMLHSFAGGVDGKFAGYGGLIRDPDGNLFGTTTEGRHWWHVRQPGLRHRVQGG